MIRRVGIAATSSLVAGVLALLAAAPALAAPKKDDPVSGDPRAKAYSQHDTGNPTKCADVASLAGTLDVQVTGTSDDGVHLNITAVPAGFELKGVVVKGSDAYNVYLGDVRTDLHAPINASGGPAGISHWFACGIKKTETPPTNNPPGDQPPGNQPPGNTNPGNGGTGGTGNTPAAQGSNAAATDAGLANTGASITLPLIAGGALLLLGGGLLYGLRRTRRQD